MADIVVNIDNLTFGDMETLMGWGKGMSSDQYSTALDVLDRVVEGGVRSLPISMADELIKAIEAAVLSEADEKN